MKILNVSETRQNLSNLINEKLEEAAYLYSISKYINIGNLDKSIEQYEQGNVLKIGGIL